MGVRLDGAAAEAGGSRAWRRGGGVLRLLGAGCAVALALGAVGCGGPASESVIAPESAQTEAATPGWSLTSTAFVDGEGIPEKHTCDGTDVSPELSWPAPPEGTVELALICDDPDAPGGTWTHWVLYGLPPEQRSLPEAVPTSETVSELGGAKQGRNGSGEIGYRGPCPPPGPVHHYHFRLYGLNAATGLAAGAEQAEVEEAMEGHVVARAELVGLYAR